MTGPRASRRRRTRRAAKGAMRPGAVALVLLGATVGALTATASSTAAAAQSPSTPGPVATTPAPAVTTPAPAATTPAPAATTPTPAATTPASTATTPVLPPPAELDPASPPSYRATRATSYAARLVVPVAVRSLPSNRGRKVVALRPYGSWNGGPVVLQIADSKLVKETRWLRVRLPTRPNGSTGWIKASSVEIEQLRYRILISRRAHRLTLLRDGKAVASTRVVVGAPGTPTPRGSFAVLEQVRQPGGSTIGPWALHLTAHSEVLDNYGGGPGRVALHGRSGALLNDPLGSSRSHGCIRMPNAFVTRLAKVATEGTPVIIS